jgi:hypothetical protein
MLHADSAMEFASSTMMNLLEVIRGTDPINPNAGSLIGELTTGMISAEDSLELRAAALNIMKLYDATVAGSRYDGKSILEGYEKTFQLGGGQTLKAEVSDWSSDNTMVTTLVDRIKVIDVDAPLTITSAIEAAEELSTAIAKELGTLGSVHKVISQNRQLLDSRMTTMVAAEGRISNADIANESSRLARSELLAQNAMISIMYSRSYAAFAVTSLFR